MVWRNAIRIVFAAGEALSKAFTRAVKEEIRASQQAASRRADETDQDRTRSPGQNSSKLGISLQEAMKILNVKDPLNAGEVNKNYKHLFEINDRNKGGSLYLQSKIYRAKERLDEELWQQGRREELKERKGSGTEGSK